MGSNIERISINDKVTGRELIPIQPIRRIGEIDVWRIEGVRCNRRWGLEIVTFEDVVGQSIEGEDRGFCVK